LVPIDTVLYELFSTLSISSVSLNGVNVPFTRTNSAVKIGVNYPAGTVFTVRTIYSGTPPTAQTNPLGGSGMLPRPLGAMKSFGHCPSPFAHTNGGLVSKASQTRQTPVT